MSSELQGWTCHLNIIMQFSHQHCNVRTKIIPQIPWPIDQKTTGRESIGLIHRDQVPVCCNGIVHGIVHHVHSLPKSRMAVDKNPITARSRNNLMDRRMSTRSLVIDVCTDKMGIVTCHLGAEWINADVHVIHG